VHHQRAADLDPVSALPLDALGQTYYQKADYDQALEYYERALRREPTFAGIYVNKGNALEKKNDPGGAILSYRKALELFPDYGLAHYNLGMALGMKNDIPGALRGLKTALECDPNLISAYYGLGELLLVYQRDPEGAVKAYEGPTLRLPKSAHGHFQLANFLKRLGRSFQAAERYRKVIELQPDFPGAQAGLGVALATLGQWDGALEAYQAALGQLDQTVSSFDKANLLVLLGTGHAQKGDWDKALRRYTEALALDSLKGKVHSNLGAAYKNMWKLEEACRSYEAALKEDANNPKMHYELAWVLLELSELDKAIKHARKSLELAPNQALPHGILAQAHMEKGEMAESIQAAKEGKDLLTPTQPDYGSLQVLYEVSQKLRKGEELIPALMRGEASPADVLERNGLATVAGLKHKKFAAATRLFAQSFADDPVRANNVLMGGRYRGACFAVLAGTGQAEKEAALKEEDKAKLRRQALEWLEADLEAWKRLYQFTVVPPKEFVLQRVRLWLKEPSLKNVREPDLAKLPAEERAKWARFWADVKAFGTSPADPLKKPGTDLAKLRKLAPFPTLNIVMNFQFNGPGSLKRDHWGNVIDPAKKIEELLPQLKGTARANQMRPKNGWRPARSHSLRSPKRRRCLPKPANASIGPRNWPPPTKTSGRIA
jgi:tetratricopeptide (TPR) repeat protein